MIATPKAILLGFIARLIHPFIKTQGKTWIFASNNGRTYGEGSRSIMEYVLQNDNSINCIYITRNQNVYNELTKKGVRCELNWSLRGVLAIARADTIFFTHGPADIYYAYKKRNRRFYFLTHGQPYKVAMNALVEKEAKPISTYDKIKNIISDFLFELPSHNNTFFVSCCSSFLAKYLKLEYNNECKIVVLGSPRNDVLFTPEKLHHDFFSTLKGKIVITYMPTHRKYGLGIPSPTLFINDRTKQQWLREHNVVVLIKQHPNMIPQIKDFDNNDVIIDVTKKGLDPQCTMINSDIMVTDYSSVWMDWLLLNKPLLHFFYDDFKDDDAGFYYDLHEDPAGKICESEDELFEAIKHCILAPQEMLPPKRLVNKYHRYIDGESSKRHYDKIVQRYNNETE